MKTISDQNNSDRIFNEIIKNKRNDIIYENHYDKIFFFLMVFVIFYKLIRILVISNTSDSVKQAEVCFEYF